METMNIDNIEIKRLESAARIAVGELSAYKIRVAIRKAEAGISKSIKRLERLKREALWNPYYIEMPIDPVKSIWESLADSQK